MLTIFKLNLFTLKSYNNVSVTILNNDQITNFKLIYLIANNKSGSNLTSSHFIIIINSDSSHFFSIIKSGLSYFIKSIMSHCIIIVMSGSSHFIIFIIIINTTCPKANQ